MKRFITYMVALVCCFSVALAKDIKTLVVTPNPQMACSNCENKIKKNLRNEKGIKDIVTDLEKQTITIKYDADKTTSDAIVKKFSKIGYKVSEVKAGSCCAAKMQGCGAAQQGCCKDKASADSKKQGCCKDKQQKSTEKKDCCKKNQ